MGESYSLEIFHRAICFFFGILDGTSISNVQPECHCI